MLTRLAKFFLNVRDVVGAHCGDPRPGSNGHCYTAPKPSGHCR